MPHPSVSGVSKASSMRRRVSSASGAAPLPSVRMLETS